MTSSARCPTGSSVMVVLAWLALSPTLAAQTPRRPAIDLRQLPTMLRSVIPADFNGDGRLDLIAGEPGPSFFAYGRVVVRLGTGNGTFGAPIPTGLVGEPVTVGDFNGDNLIDAVVVGDSDAMWILPGRGTGRFLAARTLDPVADFRFAESGDWNADGKRDLVIGHGTTVEVQPGGGDFTFGPTMVLPAGNQSGPSAAIRADFNGDQRPDLAIAQRHGSVFVYLNRGGLLFAPVEVPIADEDIFGLTAADLDRDGDQDLVVPHTLPAEVAWEPGGVAVVRGAGDGTFAAPVEYTTGLRGPMTAAAGDFNRDGIVDIAVGGRSQGWNDISDILSYWDSVVIFPGRGDGRLAPAVPFRLDSVPDLPGVDGPYINRHHRLVAADINHDGRMDLVASPGAVILNRALTTNRPPVVDAGDDIIAPPDGPPIMTVKIVEPDYDWLFVEWRDDRGVLITREPSFEFNFSEDVTLTVTVTDVRGASASDTVRVHRNPASLSIRIIEPAAGQHYASGGRVPIRWEMPADGRVDHFVVSVSDDDFRTQRVLHDAVPAGQREFIWINAGPPGTTWRARVIAFQSFQGLAQATSSRFTIDQPAPGAFPWPWEEHADTGAVGAPGSASYSDGTFTVRGSGSDIWGTADEFHWVGTRVRGNFSVTARVLSVENVSQWTKAGLMIRESVLASSRHASLFVTPTTVKGVAFQRRATSGGLSVHTPGPALTAPIWLKLVRAGEVVSAFYRKNITDGWSFVGSQTFASLPDQLHVMLVVSSHVDRRLAAARFDRVLIDDTDQLSATDIGSTVPGTTRTDGVTTTMEGNGADIWGTADAFHFYSASARADATLTVRVRSVEDTHEWAKAGLMIREHIGAGSKHVMIIASPGKGISMQYRPTEDGPSVEVARRAGSAPVWLRLSRTGDVFTSATSTDGITWSALGSVTLRIAEGQFNSARAGLAVTSHAAGTLATAVFDDLVIER